MLPTEHVELLKSFVALSRANPKIINTPELKFYKDYLAELGVSFPLAEDAPSNNEAPKAEPKAQHFEEQEEEPEIPYPDLDNTGVIPADSGDELPNGDPNKEVTDEELEKANEERDLAGSAFSNGNYEDALKHYTAAIELNPGSALLHAKRANVLLKLSKPVAAIRDCDKAISINPDSATGYKFRGRANRLLGNWIEAHKDLALACKIDYDDSAAEWLKEVEPNAKKLQEYNRANERRVEEKEVHERRERVQRAQEANRRAAEEAKSCPNFDGPGLDGEGLGIGDFLNDPELIKLIQEDPSLLTKLTDVMQNPQNLMKYLGDPAILKLMQKISAKKGGGGGFPFGGGFSGSGQGGGFPFGGFPGAPKGGNSFGGADKPTESKTSFTPPPEPTQPKKAPEPDLD